MKKKYPNEFKFFDQEEKELIETFEEALEKGQLNSLMLGRTKKGIKETARNTSQNYRGEKTDIITLTIDSDISKKLKSKAKKQGINYQDLASSILQKFANS